jgi:demethylmenaquinone methyltransferase/2-methoxy-6-polyprenyl-1,4-benzoquinol methylase
VEISLPPARLLRGAYLLYLQRVIPLVGRLFLGNPDNYRMLGHYTRGFGDCAEFARMLGEAGLEVRHHAYFFGCATGVSGRKPPA